MGFRNSGLSPQLGTGRASEAWLEGIEREFRFLKITEDQDKVDAMVIYGGDTIARLEKSLPNPPDPDAPGQPLTGHEKLKTKLNDYFLPKRNLHHARYKFNSLRPMTGETVVAYTARLREQVTGCEFTDEADRILEHLIQTIEDKSLVQRALNKRWTLDQLLTEAAQIEDIKIQMKDMKASSYEEHNVARVGKKQAYSSKNRVNPRVMTKGSDKPRKPNPGEVHKRGPECGRCGFQHDRRSCPAYGKRCAKCSGWNHFAKKCLSGEKADSPRKPRYGESVKYTSREEKTQSDTDEDDFIPKVMKHLRIKRVNTATNQEGERIIRMELNDVCIKMEPDSGADVNVMDEKQFNKFQERTESTVVLRSTKMKLKALKDTLPVKGTFQATLRNENRGIETEFVVLKGEMDSRALISHDSLKALVMLWLPYR